MEKLRNKFRKSSTCVGLKPNKEVECNRSHTSEFQTGDSGIVSDQSSLQEIYHHFPHHYYYQQSHHQNQLQYTHSFLPPPNTGFIYPLPYPHQIYPPTMSMSSHNLYFRPQPAIDYGPVHPYMKTTNSFYNCQQTHTDAYTSVASSLSSSTSCSVPSSTSTSDTDQLTYQIDSQSTTSELFIPRRKLHKKVVRKSRKTDSKVIPEQELVASKSNDTDIFNIDGKRWDRVPYKALMNIFSYLSIGEIAKCAQVCRNWYFIAWQPGLWRILDFSYWLKERANKKLASQIKQNDINLCVKNLIKLLGGNQQPFCPLIDKIVLEKCSELSDETVIYFSDACPNLKTVNLKKCSKISNIALFHLLSKCKSITHLNIEGCKLISSINILPELDTPISTGVDWSNLTWLNLSFCVAIDDSSLCIMASRFRKLQKLYLRNLIRVTDTGIKYVARYCFQLEELSLNHLTKITDQALITVGERAGSSLSYLSLANCPSISDLTLRSLAQSARKLHYLNLHRCILITDAGIIALAHSSNTQLTSLNISYCSNITDTAITNLARYCINIQQLDFSNCPKITDQAVVQIINYLKYLQMLNIDKTSISIVSVDLLSQKYRNCDVVHSIITAC